MTDLRSPERVAADVRVIAALGRSDSFSRVIFDPREVFGERSEAICEDEFTLILFALRGNRGGWHIELLDWSDGDGLIRKGERANVDDVEFIEQEVVALVAVATLAIKDLRDQHIKDSAESTLKEAA